MSRYGWSAAIGICGLVLAPETGRADSVIEPPIFELAGSDYGQPIFAPDDDGQNSWQIKGDIRLGEDSKREFEAVVILNGHTIRAKVVQDAGKVRVEAVNSAWSELAGLPVGAFMRQAVEVDRDQSQAPNWVAQAGATVCVLKTEKVAACFPLAVTVSKGADDSVAFTGDLAFAYERGFASSTLKSVSGIRHTFDGIGTTAFTEIEVEHRSGLFGSLAAARNMVTRESIITANGGMKWEAKKKDRGP